MIEYQVKGLAELQRALDALPQEVKRGGLILRGLAEGANLIRDEAKRRAPVLKDAEQFAQVGKRGKAGYRKAYWGSRNRIAGAIKAGIVTQKKGFVNGMPTVIVRVRSRGYIFAQTQYRRIDRLRKGSLAGNPNYWWLVEFGTSRTRAQPFMRPAFEAQKFAALARVRDAIAEEIVQAAAKFAPQLRMAA